MSINFLIPLIILVEVIIILLFFVVLLVRKIVIYFEDKSNSIKKAEISKILNDCLANKKSFESKPNLKAFSSKKVLLTTLEAYDQRFNHQEWKKIKEDVSKDYLLPAARKWATSKFWTRRNFAARCFALAPSREDEKEIVALVDDPIFLVRSIAAAAAVQLEKKEIVYKIIYHMSVEPGYAHYFYRDVLVNGSLQVFRWVEEFASQDKDPSIHLSCLEVLASKTLAIQKPFIKEDLKSDNLNIRLAAIKLFNNSPQYDAAETLYKYMDDPNEKVRVETVRGLEFITTDKSYMALEKALEDSAWPVRSQAANTLKKMGRKGIEILTQQDPARNKEAYETARYALQTL